MQLPSWLRGPETWYDKVNTGGEGSNLDGQDDEFELHRFRLATLNRRWRWIIIISAANIAFFVLSMLVLSAFYGMIVARANSDDNLKLMSQYSPVLEAIEAKPQNRRINGTLFPTRKASFSRAEPGDANAEALWAYYGQQEFFSASRKDMMLVGADLEVSVQFPDETFGFGPQSYVASLDSVNKMHCLNLLRKAAFSDYPKQSTEEHSKRDDHETDDMRWLELRQCTDILAQDIMCHADTELVTYKFLDMQKQLQPDYSVKRKCRSWDQVMAWQDEHKVDRAKVMESIVFTGDARTKLSENERGYYERNGFNGSVIYPFGNGFDE